MSGIITTFVINVLEGQVDEYGVVWGRIALWIARLHYTGHHERS